MADAIFNMTKKEKKDETYTKRCVEILKNVGVQYKMNQDASDSEGNEDEEDDD